MKYFFRCGKGMYKPLTSISRIDTVDNYPNMYDIHFSDGTTERLMDSDKTIREMLIG
ncbi:hypothetical protein N9Q68_01445 [Polaribacter sp.]|nr:hypothetical protein [Polaribacter sp.]